MVATMRAVRNPGEFTPFGLWIRENCRSSVDGLSNTNLDYVLEDWRCRSRRRIMLVEEKRRMAPLARAQAITFEILDDALRFRSEHPNPPFEYMGFFLVQFDGDLPEDGVQVNYQPTTARRLIEHLNFDRMVCEGLSRPFLR